MFDDTTDVKTTVIVSMVSMVETNFMFSEVNQYFSNYFLGQTKSLEHILYHGQFLTKPIFIWLQDVE